MTAKKHRLTVTVDSELIEAGRRAVESGQAESVSGWVSAALEEKIRRDRQLALLATAVADYEEEFGQITADEIATQRKADRQGATVVRGQRRQASRKASWAPSTGTRSSRTTTMTWNSSRRRPGASSS
jgi:hypothetical protein